MVQTLSEVKKRAGRVAGQPAQAHSVNSNAVSCVLTTSLPSLSGCIKRTETISRLPLISGIRPSEGSMRRRRSWNVRPAGRFC